MQSLNFALAQKENTSFTTYKDQIESNRYARYISYQWYFKRCIEAFNANLWKILQRKFVCLITIQLNTLTDVPYQITVGGAFVYVCENLWKRSS